MGAIAVPTTADGAGWKIVGRRTAAGGGHPATLLAATINHPRRIAVEFIGGHRDASWICRYGIRSVEGSDSYSAGLYTLPDTSGQGQCTVVADISGQGTLTVAILTHA